VDTRCDIYALGVLLYELLTSTTPFDRQRLKTMGYDEMRRVIREEEPPKPSTRMTTQGQAASTASVNRQSDPKRLSQLLRGEPDWIVMKCLEKDRNRRYETASALGRDVDRYLHDEAVQACPPSAGYRLRKFARKDRTLLRVAGAFVLLLVLAAAVSTWQAVRATRERDRAEKSLQMAHDAVDRLFTRVSQNPKLKTHAMEQFRKELLKDAKEFYERFIRKQFDTPNVRHDLGLAHQRLGEIGRELGDYAAAEESLTKSIALLGELVRGQPEVADYQRDLAASYFALGLVCFDTAHWKEAEAAFEQALAIQEKQAHAYPEAAEYRYALAKTYGASGLMYYRSQRLENAETRFHQALDMLSQLVQDFPLASEYQSLIATTQWNLGQLYISRGWYERAQTALEAAQSVYGRLVRGRSDAPPRDWESLARCDAILGTTYCHQAQTEKAEAAQLEALEIFERLAHEHPLVVEYSYDVGRCYAELARTADEGGRTDVALERFGKAIEIMEGAKAKGFLWARTALTVTRINRAAARAGGGDHACDRRGRGSGPARGVKFESFLRHWLRLLPSLRHRTTRQQTLAP
jgi:eukaryotic-like serine/threonine-protein kinase